MTVDKDEQKLASVEQCCSTVVIVHVKHSEVFLGRFRRILVNALTIYQ